MHSVRSCGVDRQVVADAGEVAGAVGRAAGAGGVELGLGVGQADDQHAVVQERQHHRDQGGFLAAVQAGGGGEDAGRLAGERAALPEERGAVPEVLERRRHVAEARRAAEGEAGAFLQVAQLAVGRARLGHRGGGADAGGDARHGAQARRGAGHALDAFGDQLGHAPHRAADRVVQDEDIGHAGIIEGMEKNTWRGLWEFGVAVARRFFEDRSAQTAGSLTYTTLLSLVPLLTVALALSTAFPVFDQVGRHAAGVRAGERAARGRRPVGDRRPDQLVHRARRAADRDRHRRARRSPACC